jgi:hypothetical protein
LLDTRSLSSGSYVLSFAVDGDPSIHTLTFTVYRLGGFWIING